MSDAAVLGLILQSALRSLLLGVTVYAAVKACRLRDLGAETAIWSAVLLAALAMPVLSLWLPGLDILPVAKVPAANAAIVVHARPSWVAAHAGVLMLAAYVAIAGVGIVRLGLGLVLTARIHAQAEPVAELWTAVRDIRESAAIDAPLSYAGAILLPVDWRDWNKAKLAAVLAHEDSHVRRGDFFILLLASVHRALFWFSPFAWWLQGRLGELAETASDKAAVTRIADPAGYAEILIEVSRRARRGGPAVAMARGPGVARRIDQVLAGIPERSLGAAGRVLALAGVLVLGLGLAEVRAAASDPGPIPTSAGPSSSLPRSAAPRARAVTAPYPAAARHHGAPVPAAPIKAVATGPTPDEDAVSYDPRALLDQPEPVIIGAAILAGARTESPGE